MAEYLTEAQNEKRYVKWRNVLNDMAAGPWVIWDDLGPYPTQEEFIQDFLSVIWILIFWIRKEFIMNLLAMITADW
jgi:hypothetical protein